MAESVWVALGLVVIVIVGFMSFYSVGPTEVGLVRKRFGKKLPGSHPVFVATIGLSESDYLNRHQTI